MNCKHSWQVWVNPGFAQPAGAVDVCHKKVLSFNDMTNLSKELREKLESVACIGEAELLEKSFQN